MGPRLHLHPTRSAQLFVMLTLVVALLLGATANAQSSTVAHASRICSITRVYNKLGPTYVDTIEVSHMTCLGGERVIRAYNTCRIKTGGVKGRCRRRIAGFVCTEQRTSGPIQFEAAVTCTRARQAVDFTYSEDT